MTNATAQKIRRLVEEESIRVLEQFNVDEDGFEISNTLREAFEYRDIEVSEETLTYLAKLINDYNDQLDEELENPDF